MNCWALALFWLFPATTGIELSAFEKTPRMAVSRCIMVNISRARVRRSGSIGAEASDVAAAAGGLCWAKVGDEHDRTTPIRHAAPKRGRCRPPPSVPHDGLISLPPLVLPMEISPLGEAVQPKPSASRT